MADYVVRVLRRSWLLPSQQWAAVPCCGVITDDGDGEEEQPSL
jgi:hypothetical protein